jgi:hypothetical protein
VHIRGTENNVVPRDGARAQLDVVRNRMRGSRQRKPRPRTHKVDLDQCERDSLVVVRAAVKARSMTFAVTS